MSSKSKCHSTSSTYGKKSQPIDLDEDRSLLMGSDDGSDSAQPVRPSKKKDSRKSKDNDKHDVNRILRSEGSEEEGEEDEEDEDYEVSEIKAHRLKRGQTEYRVAWKNYESDDDSWEPESHLAGAKELLTKYKLEHGIGSKPKSARNSTISSRSTSKDWGSDSNSKQSASLKQKQKKQLNGHNGKEKHMSDGPSSQRSQSPSAEDDESVPQQEWHARYRKFASWDHLIKSVRTVQRDVSEQGSKRTVKKDLSDTLYVCLLWQSGKTTWVPNAVARLKLPQKMLDFYENETTMKISSKSRMSPDQL